MALKQETIDVGSKTLEEWSKKYKQCDVCGEFCHSLPVYISIKKEFYHYANVYRCSKCNKFYGIVFLKGTFPDEIASQNIRDRIKKHQQSAFSCRHYDYSEISLGKLFTPRSDETFEEYCERYKKFKEDFYKGANICEAKK